MKFKRAKRNAKGDIVGYQNFELHGKAAALGLEQIKKHASGQKGANPGWKDVVVSDSDPTVLAQKAAQAEKEKADFDAAVSAEVERRAETERSIFDAAVKQEAARMLAEQKAAESGDTGETKRGRKPKATEADATATGSDDTTPETVESGDTGEAPQA